jgi:hypothetical protein
MAILLLRGNKTGGIASNLPVQFACNISAAALVTGETGYSEPTGIRETA